MLSAQQKIVNIAIKPPLDYHRSLNETLNDSIYVRLAGGGVVKVTFAGEKTEGKQRWKSKMGQASDRNAQRRKQAPLLSSFRATEFDVSRLGNR